MLLVVELTLVLFCFRVFIYNCIVRNSWSLDRSTFPSRRSCEKVVNVSFPMKDNKGSTVSGVLSTWLRWSVFLSAINCSIRFGSSIVLNYKFFTDMILFHFIDVSVGMSIVFKFVLSEFIVRYLISLHIDMTCSIFWILIIFVLMKIVCNVHCRSSFGEVYLS